MKDETKLDDFSRVAEDKTWPPRKYVIKCVFNPLLISKEEVEVINKVLEERPLTYAI